MTEDEKLLNEVISDFENILRTKYKDVTIAYFFALGRPNLDCFTGNRCPVCVVEQTIKWIEDNNIQHEPEEAVQQSKMVN